MDCNYSKSCTYSIRLIEKLQSLDIEGNLDFNLINKAIYWAKKYHNGQYRKSGEPFYTHPLEVAYMVSDYKLTTNVIAASILHDIVEDTEVTAGMILDNFGRRIEEIVDRLTRDRPDGSKLTVEQIIDNAYEQEDKDVLLIKLIDRLHNIETIGAKSPEKIKKTLVQTFTRFISLSIYLGDDKSEKMLLLENKIIALCNQNIHNYITNEGTDNITTSPPPNIPNSSDTTLNDNFQLPSLASKSILSRIRNR